MMFAGLQRRLSEWRAQPPTTDTAIDSCAATVARQLVRDMPGLSYEAVRGALRAELRIAAQDIRLAARSGRLVG